MTKILYFLFFLTIHCLGFSTVHVGIGKSEMTPPTGTPSAGYSDRKGEGMTGVHDPLLAVALFINNGEKKVVFCSVDHLGFTYEMSQKISEKVQQKTNLTDLEVYIASSHTHSGGGSYLNIPGLGESLAGSYNQEITELYIDKTVEAIIKSCQNPVLAKIGIGYGMAEPISKYRGLWPVDVAPLSDVMILKVTLLDDTPFAVLFNFPMHPTVLKSQNRLFSADFVGFARDHLQTLLGSKVQPLYFNGAQGDILPVCFDETNPWNACDLLGTSLATTVEKIWQETKTSDLLTIDTYKHSYTFQPQATPFGLSLPISKYATEMNLMVLNHQNAFITIPGELSCLYDKNLKEIGAKLGYQHVSIFGLTNDAHGYIILPESWQHKTLESFLSFGGKEYGTQTITKTTSLLKKAAPEKSTIEQ